LWGERARGACDAARVKADASFTASMIAVSRGLGRVLPEDARLIEDPYGERFSTSRVLDFARRHARGFLYPVLESLLLHVQVRTRLLDEALLSFVDRGGAQVLLLGAGYDTRASRLEKVRERARVFEVDHPATQTRKRAVIADPANVVYVPWDFEAQQTRDLPAALRQAGLDPARPTFVLWEGVTMYLSDDAVDATTRAVAALCAPGSPFVFTYIERAALKRPSLGARLVGLVVRGVGEPLTFGFDPATLGAWLAERGFSLGHDVGMADAARVLLPARFAHRFTRGAARVAFAARA
jgi:methyltransferase (TIGR00027 family)